MAPGARCFSGLHCVVEVRTHRYAGVDGPQHLFVGRGRVAGAGDDAVIRKEPDDFFAPSSSGARVTSRVGTYPSQPRVRRPQVAGSWAALVVERQERTFEVGSERDRPRRRRGQHMVLQRLQEVRVTLRRRGDQGGQEGGRTGLRQLAGQGF